MKSGKLFLLVIFLLFGQALRATSLTGTVTQVYQDKHYVFRNFNTAKGYVRLNNGFTILAGQSAALDTFITVSGAIDLRTTGSLDLRGDLFLDQHVTWSSSGKIYGRGNAINLGGPLSLPTDTILQFIDDTIIDGHGHTLTLGAHAQLLLASDVSLTLKNMTIKTTRNSTNIPIIRCFDQKGHVTLDNVELALADDFSFRTGRMFFNNDVVMTGTSCFIYESVMQSYVLPQSLLTLDPNMTLYYFPSSQTKDLLQLQSKSAGVYLKGSGTTLQTTHTGMQLTKGRLWLDNKVTLSTRASTVVNGFVQLTTASYGTRVRSVDWSPDGRYLAVGGFGPTNTLEFQVYSFDGSTLTYVTGDNWTGGGAEVYHVRWHPNGRFLVGVGDATNDLRVYSFDGTTLTTIAVTDLTTGGAVGQVAWSPSGQYILCSTFNDSPDDKARIYRFSGTTLTLVTTISPANANSTFPNAVSWHPSERFFAFRFFVSNDGVRYIYSFNGTTATFVDSVTTANTAPGLYTNWEFSPDGDYLVGCSGRASGFSTHAVYGFTETGFVGTNSIDSFNFSTSDNVSREARWSPHGLYFVGVGGSPDDGDEFNLYQFKPDVMTKLAGYNYGTSINGVAWSRDGKYIAIGGNGPAGGHDEIEVWTVSYRFDTTTQALTNGILLGKSASGASFDLDTYVLSGATVNFAGQLMYDSTS